MVCNWAALSFLPRGRAEQLHSGRHQRGPHARCREPLCIAPGGKAGRAALCLHHPADPVDRSRARILNAAACMRFCSPLQGVPDRFHCCIRMGGICRCGCGCLLIFSLRSSAIDCLRSFFRSAEQVKPKYSCRFHLSQNENNFISPPFPALEHAPGEASRLKSLPTSRDCWQ